MHFSDLTDKVVCFANFNRSTDENYLDIGHVMNLNYASSGYEYEGLKLLYMFAFDTMDIDGIRSYWAFDDKVKLEPLIKLGMKVTEKYQNNYFGGYDHHNLTLQTVAYAMFENMTADVLWQRYEVTRDTILADGITIPYPVGYWHAEVYFDKTPLIKENDPPFDGGVLFATNKDK